MLTRRGRYVCAVALGFVAGLGSGAQADPHLPERAGVSSWASARAEAMAVRETLQGEVSAMRRLRAAQKELSQWNVERAAVGSTVRTLRPALCEEEELKRWCELFPATFGVLEDGS